MNFRVAVQIQLSVNDGPKFRFSRHFLAFAGAAGTPVAISRGIFRRICFKERFVLGGSEMPSHTLIGGRIVRTNPPSALQQCDTRQHRFNRQQRRH